MIEAAIRETEEEAGVQITADDLCFELVLHRRGDDERVDFFFSSASWSGDIANAEPDKCAELRWCAPDALPDDTVPYIAHALSCWQEGIRFDTFGWDSRAQSPDDHAVIAQ